MENTPYRSFYFDQMLLTHKITFKQKSYVIAEYERGRNLSNGGFSEVYEVRQISSAIYNSHRGRELVAKLMPAKDQNSQNLFTRQRQALLQIKQLEIQNYFVKLQDCWKDEKYYYLIFQKCRKGSLNQLLNYAKKYNKKLKKQHILYIVYSILKALRALHFANIINRDIKPQNVLLDDDLNVKIIDFGLSWVSKQEQTLQSKKQHIEACKIYGTPYYMAPQALKRDQVYNQKIDIWSLGVLLYNILFQRYPFKIQIPKDQPIKREDLNNRLFKSIMASEDNFNFESSTLNKQDFEQLVQLNKKMLQKKHKVRKTAAQLLSLDIFKKFTLEYEEDVKKSLGKYYFEYFNQKISDPMKWKKQVIFEPVQLHPQLTKRLRDPHKVHITKVLHSQKFGFFLLLSNNSLFAYFNNQKVLKYQQDIFNYKMNEYGQLEEQQNQEILEQMNQIKILTFIKDKHFIDLIQKQEKEGINLSQLPGFEYFDVPDCYIQKIFYNKNALIVRLSNQTIQVFFLKTSEQQKGKQEFISRSITLNNNQKQKDQIVYRKNNEVYTFQNYQQAIQSPACKKYIQFIRDIFIYILDNSSISLKKYNLERLH